MLIIFWFIVLSLIVIALLTVIPWVKQKYLQYGIIFFVFSSTLIIYCVYGNGKQLNNYYSTAAVEHRQKQNEIRPLLAILNNEEIKLRLKLEESPGNLLVECQLYDVLAIRALQRGDVPLANAFWTKALEKLGTAPNQPETLQLKKRIVTLQQNLNSHLNQN